MDFCQFRQVEFAGWWTLTLFVVNMPPSSWAVYLRECKNRFANRNLFLFHAFGLDLCPEREFELKENVVIMGLRTVCRHVELIISDLYDFIE